MSTTKTRKTSNTSRAELDSNQQFEKFFVDSLKDIYWAEKQLTRALPKMQKASTSKELKDAFAGHLKKTEKHITRLDEVFEELGEKAQGKKCEAMEGLIKEGETIVDETQEGSMTRDAGVIMAAQKVEHYEIATYGTLVQLATTMKQDTVAEILSQTLAEEKEADKLLTEIAVNNINRKAEEEGSEMEE